VRRIGTLQPSLAGLGCNNFGRLIDYEAAQAVIDAALEAGVTHFDTSDNYGDGLSEEFLGRALGARRADVVITTKFGSVARFEGVRRGSPESVRRSCEDSLRRLGSDYIDLFLMHYPDPETPIEDTLGALVELKAEGKVREIGCSNFTPEELDGAAGGFVALQSSYSLLDRTAEPEVLPKCLEHGLAFLPYFPLASGMLTGKYRRGEGVPEGSRLATEVFGGRYLALRTDDSFDLVEALEAFARERGHTLLELALSWLGAQEPVASIVAGATKPAQVHANASAASAWRLSEEDLRTVDELTAPAREVSYTVHSRSPAYTRTPPGVAVNRS
jgi:aryl-alcohol dehydrogenase-like predicted oxidoreductase